MTIPIIKYANTFLNIISPFMKIKGIALFPFIILRDGYYSNDELHRLITHETIHIRQQIELLVIPFYLFYFIEWFIKLFIYGGGAYRNLSFEREAKQNERNKNYLNERKFWGFIKYL